MVILDQAGWHTTRKLKVPKNLTVVSLPPACPELNAAENIWQYLRQTYLSNLQPGVQELHRHSRCLPG
jgi:transposase